VDQNLHITLDEEKTSGSLVAQTGEEKERVVVSIEGKKLYQVKVIHSHETITGVPEKELELAPRDLVIISTKHGKDLGRILCPIEKNNHVEGEDILTIHRKATEQDISRFEANKGREDQAFRICQQKILEHNLEMKLVSTHYLLDEPKILFFFTADNRIDFRELVKDLVAIFKTRIELRQIGVRDEARVLGGMGICGRAFCCHAVTDRLNPVSIKMAKEQNISLNSLKISGPCGRLLCCLGYEYEFYHCEKKNLPEEGMQFVINNEQFTITEINVLVRTIKLQGNTGRIMTLPFHVLQLKEDGKWSIDTNLFNELNIHV
jgi:cell fate regulator YaaT (PSP1 superfamily)